MFKVFVYGTLKPNQANYPYYCQGKVIEKIPVFTHGKLYHLPTLGYPAMVKSEGIVEGYLLTFLDDNWLQKLDDLEDYQEGRDEQLNGYQRCLITVYNASKMPISDAWAYFMSFPRVKSLNGVYLPSGNWSP